MQEFLNGQVEDNEVSKEKPNHSWRKTLSVVSRELKEYKGVNKDKWSAVPNSTKVSR